MFVIHLRPILLAACLFICATVTAQDWYAVTDPLDADEPVARISSPGDSADIVVADVTEPVAILGQATDSHYSYDAAGRLAQIRHQKADGSALAQYSYQRDAKGRLTRATEETGGQSTNKSWEYDADGKLTQESISAAGITRTCRYAYDSVGNRVEKDCDGQKTRYVYNQLDQLTEEQTTTDKTTYRWDGRGNLIEKQTPAQTIRYEWSSDNRLLKASDGSTSIRYGYDALGRRISRTREAGGQKQETQWILDTARPYSEIVLERSRQNGGAWQETRYTHTPDGVGQLISEQRQGKTLHVYEDGQGSARLITDESGQIIETLDFDAFGNEEAGNPQESRHRYTGESYDSATGLYHLRARDYDPKTGRFISMDEHPGSQSIPLTLNKYLYGNADPVNHIDPGGDFGLTDFGAAMNSMSSLATIAVRTLSIYNKVSTAVDMIQFAMSIKDLVGGIVDAKDLFEKIKKDPYTGGACYRGKSYCVNMADALEQFAWNTPRAVAIATPDWGIKMANPAFKVNKFIIFMSVFNAPVASMDMPTGLKVRFKGEKVPVVLQFGNRIKAPGGFLGIGLDGSKKSRRSMYRMDHHPAELMHGGSAGMKGNELAYWIDGNYHHHVYKFGGGQ